MRKASRRPAVLVLLAMVASLLGAITPTAAFAAESIPTLQWPAVNIGTNVNVVTTSPTGSGTLPCTTTNGGSNLVTYSASGQLVQDISRTSVIDGVTNCIPEPAVDKNGDVYGIPFGQTSGGSWAYGANLLAYSGNTLKWKYPVSCSSGQGSQVAVGSNGNIYATALQSDGLHLIGLTPSVASGQTQPTKVLDVKLPASDCSTFIRPYKDGLVLHGQSSGNARYYSYAGKYLGQATIGDIWYEKINADGKLFKASYVSGSYTSAKISMYSPSLGDVQWATIASTSGANVNDVQIYPVSGGGVVALITEQKMIGGVPASPTEYIKTLAVLNASGTVTKSINLSNAYSQSGITGTYGGTYAVSDNLGKIVVVRKMTLNTGIGYPTTVPAIAIAVYDITSDTWSYQQVMRGDLTKTGGPSGYSLPYGEAAMGLTSGTLYLIAKCTNNCTNYDQKLYPIQVSSLGTVYPRGDVLNRTARPSAAYVALGDSFSSGEGVPSFEAATDVTNANMCHRSTTAYARLIAGTSSSIPSLGTGGFRACSGAVTTNITDLGQWDERFQLDLWPDATTQLVTLTIGGNDIGFADFAKACVLGTCQVGSSAYNTSLDKINNVLPGALTATYQKILAAFPNAQIYVMDYPHVIADKQSSDPFDSRCPYMYNSTGDTGAAHYPWEDAWAARDIVTKLDTKISTAISGMNDTRLHYVPANASGSPFVGHGICDTGTSYFQNLDQYLHNEAYVFHPNATGQQKYADLMSTEINAS